MAPGRRGAGAGRERELLRDNVGWSVLGHGVRDHPDWNADHTAQLRRSRRRQPVRRADPGHRREFLRDNHSGRDQHRLLVWLRHGLQNHPRRNADYAAQLREHGREQSLRGVDPGRRRKFLWDNEWRRGRRRRHSLRNYGEWHADARHRFDHTDRRASLSRVGFQDTNGTFYGTTSLPGTTMAQSSAWLWAWRRLWKRSPPPARWEQPSRYWEPICRAQPVSLSTEPQRRSRFCRSPKSPPRFRPMRLLERSK